ncbi:sigma-70 family RNA polymerase sigma factor [Kitasatospora phosalacinea]|uniref:RNA polymerase sigma factor n=1 Tax=Kitasatospora phosalacinea TaxID=2065 RepID=A0A9W6PP15_9ACTN|nr:sigma-70 family RNA polymerase sigma factor [Kitasatospora phosalacinea]GLW58577.1 RNA polymerase sigma factor [Kitasatospora phosalacinea]
MTRWEDTLTDLVSTRGPALKRYAYLLTASDEAAEDLLQEALLKVFTSGRRRGVPGAVEAYLRTAMLNTFLDTVRRHQRWLRILPALSPRTSVPDHSTAVSDFHDASAALAALSDRQRACVVLRYYEDLTVPEIATRLGISQGSIKRYLADATARLQPLLQSTDGGEST